tara:strand:- start:582 stop:1028 length:447 start_codon:yes stop_codon:yes gene_type:complete
MKAVLTLLFSLLFSFISNAQKFDAQEVYNAYEAQENVLVMSFNKEMEDAIDMDFDYKEQIKNVEGDVSFLKMMVSINDETSKGIAKEIEQLMKHANYSMKMIDDEDQTVTMYLKQKGKNISEVHFLGKDEEGEFTFFFTLLGDLVIKE